MFVGRKTELESLNASYRKAAFQFPVIYGRRRVGKTTLINEFCKGKKAIYFVAVQSTAKENLAILSDQILSVLAPEAPRNPFASFREAIDYVFAASRHERIIFAIDEYPYLASSDGAVSSILQAAIDRNKDQSKLFLILCGSSMSFMETQVLGNKSPLYGRRTAQYKLLPFDYLDAAQMLPGFSNKDRIVLYGVTGGVPEYLSRIENRDSVRENLRALFFDPAGRLFEEPTNLIKQELRSPETYTAIIAAIAGGASRLNEVATKVGMETSQCSKMLSTLTELGLVRRETPVTEDRSKKTIYVLDDLMFRFWYRFVLPDISRITAGLGKVVCDEVLKEQLSSHTGLAFEECAKQYLWRAQKGQQLPVAFKKIGRWWGSNPADRCEEEIDILAFSGVEALFGECKWTNTLVGEDVLDRLVRRSELLTRFKKNYYLLFSKSGFTNRLKARAAGQGEVTLVRPDDMFDQRLMPQ